MKNLLRDLHHQEKIFTDFLSKQPARNQNIIRSAFTLAKQAHVGQKRDEGDPYFIHPLRAAIFLIKNLKITNPDIICAALLHDVVEDAGVSLKQIQKQFGKKITILVKNLTRPRPKNETETAKKISKGRKYRAILRADKNTRLIKCADMLDNLRSMLFISKHHPTYLKFPRWLEEANKYDLPLAKKTSHAILMEMKKALSKAKKTIRTHP